MFELTFPNITIILLAVGTLIFIFAALVGFHSFFNIVRHCKASSTDDINETKFPKASVIVYSHKAETFIREYLDTLLAQDYPDFEVIVVNDYVVDDMTQEIVEDMAKVYANLHITYVPQDSRNVSRRKLAITLGIKAAKGDVVLTTSSIAKITSAKWLKTMLRQFANPETDVVIGYSHTDKTSIRGFGRWYRSFDFMITTARWISAVIEGKTYRGDGFNLAYRKSVFFANKGFAKTVHLQNGEDDLFISQITTPTNTAIEISPEGQLTIDWGENEKRMWLDMKERYAFTSHYLKSSAFRMQNVFSVSVWVGLALLVASSFVALPNLIPGIISAVVMIAFFAYLIFRYRQVATLLNGIRLWWSIPIFVYLRPIINVAYRLSFNSRKTRNFTWQRKR